MSEIAVERLKLEVARLRREWFRASLERGQAGPNLRAEGMMAKFGLLLPLLRGIKKLERFRFGLK